MRKKTSYVYFFSAKEKLEMFGTCAQVPKTVLVMSASRRQICDPAPDFFVASARCFTYAVLLTL